MRNTSMISTTYVFNQYYFEFLKKIRDKARSRKYDSREARHILKGVKKHYQSYDKSSDEYREWFAAANQDPCGEAGAPVLYKEIEYTDIAAILDAGVLDHFVTILKVLMVEKMSNADLEGIVKALRSLNKKEAFDAAVAAIEDADVREKMQGLYERFIKHKNNDMDDALKKIEGTSLGKLAKEIMQDINIEELQSTMEDGDILKSLSNPEGSLTKVLSTVSAKMISKMASGEIKQESLLEDAMKLASELGMGAAGAGGSGGGLGGLGNMGEMIKQMQKMGLGGMGGQGGGRGPRAPKARHVRRKMKPKKPEQTA